jgi:GntR family transcriptional regulator / MocR family aminotransferase
MEYFSSPDFRMKMALAQVPFWAKSKVPIKRPEMGKRSAFITLAGIALDRSKPSRLHRQLYAQLSEAILTRRLVPGTRLPPTRALAAELGVSRNTVVNAFEQLLAEGYIEGKVGSGTYVSSSLPDEILRLRAKSAPSQHAVQSHLVLSGRGSLIAATPVSPWRDEGRPRAFRPGVPALDAFPFETWARLAHRRWRILPRELLTYGDAAGYPPLREAIASYLGASRGVRCESQQVIVVSGSQQGLDLADACCWIREMPCGLKTPATVVPGACCSARERGLSRCRSMRKG